MPLPYRIMFLGDSLWLEREREAGVQNEGGEERRSEKRKEVRMREKREETL